MIRSLAHYIKYLAIYFVLGQTFLLSSWEKWSGKGLPEWFTKQFEHTFLATIPGLTLSYYLLATMEGIVFILVVVSLFMGDWRPAKAQKNWLKLAIAFGALTFGALGFGQNLTSDFAGAAELFAYFGATLVVWMVVSADESAAARAAKS
jgi:hypothetical protein